MPAKMRWQRLRCRFYDWRANFGLAEFRYCQKPADGVVRVERKDGKPGRPRLACAKHMGYAKWLPNVKVTYTEGSVEIVDVQVLSWRKVTTGPLNEWFEYRYLYRVKYKKGEEDGDITVAQTTVALAHGEQVGTQASEREVDDSDPQR